MFPDLIGTFIDGPSQDLKKGRIILDRNVRPLKLGAAALFFSINKNSDREIPIIPVGMWAPKKISQDLWETNWKNREITKKYLRHWKRDIGKINYVIRMGEPIYPSDKQILGLVKTERNEQLTQILEKRIIALSRAP
jgi:hypothetical protein